MVGSLRDCLLFFWLKKKKKAREEEERADIKHGRYPHGKIKWNESTRGKAQSVTDQKSKASGCYGKECPSSWEHIYMCVLDFFLMK